MNRIDCRGLACPAPVLQTKRLIEKEGPGLVQIALDNEAAGENVARFLGTQNYRVSVKRDGWDFLVTGTREDGMGPDTRECEVPDIEKRKIMVMVTSDTMGHGDDELGSRLVVNFLRTLREMGDELWRLVFLNSGVKLTVGGCEVLSDLRELAEDGVTILVCGTCLNHFNLLEKKQVGETTNMLDIVTAMQLADKVISI